MTFNNTSSSSSVSETATKSVVCSVKLQKLEDHYSTMLSKCMDGDNSYAELVSPYSNKATWKAPCRCSMITDLWKDMEQSDRLNIRKLFCHNDYFNYLNGRVPLTLNSIQLYDGQNKNNNHYKGGAPLLFSKVITAVSVLVIDGEESPSIVMILATLDAKLLMTTYDPIKGKFFSVLQWYKKTIYIKILFR